MIPELEHVTITTHTRNWRDLFRRRYWVRCWECDLRDGPYTRARDAKDRAWLLTYGVDW